MLIIMLVLIYFLGEKKFTQDMYIYAVFALTIINVSCRHKLQSKVQLLSIFPFVAPHRED
jgi:hypothetical protein